MFYQISLSPPVKRCAIIINKYGMYNFPNNLRNIREVCKLHRMIAQCLVPPTPKMKIRSILAKDPWKPEIKPSNIVLPYMIPTWPWHNSITAPSDPVATANSPYFRIASIFNNNLYRLRYRSRAAYTDSKRRMTHAFKPYFGFSNF